MPNSIPKTAQHLALQQQLDEFLKSGGKIQQVEQKTADIAPIRKKLANMGFNNQERGKYYKRVGNQRIREFLAQSDENLLFLSRETRISSMTIQSYANGFRQVSKEYYLDVFARYIEP